MITLFKDTIYMKLIVLKSAEVRAEATGCKSLSKPNE